MFHIRNKMLRAAINLAIRRKSPNQIPMSGMERLRKRDYCSTYLTEDGARRFYVEKIDKNGVEGIWFPQDHGPGYPASIPVSEINNFGIKIEQYYGELQATYDSAWDYFFGLFSFLPQRNLAIERLKRAFYNRRHIAHADRYKVLATLLDMALNDDDELFGELYISSEKIASKIHGPRWAQHPDNSKVLKYYSFVLGSFTETNDLEEDGHGFRLKPKALKTLSDFEEDQRRHDDQISQQRSLMWLTAALVFVGLLQAIGPMLWP